MGCRIRGCVLQAPLILLSLLLPMESCTGSGMMPASRWSGLPSVVTWHHPKYTIIPPVKLGSGGVVSGTKEDGGVIQRISQEAIAQLQKERMNERDRMLGARGYLFDEEDQAMYDTVGLDDMEYDELDETYYYPCPCGDRFEIKHLDVELGVRIALCPSCSLILGVTVEGEKCP